MTPDPRGPRPIPLYELALDQPMRRGITSINVRPDDKAVFEQLQHLWSLREGRPLTQWEVFTRVLADAVAVRRTDLERAGAR